MCSKTSNRRWTNMRLEEALERKVRSIAAEGHDSQRTAAWYREVVKLYGDFLVQKGLAATVDNLTVDNAEWFLSELRTTNYTRQGKVHGRRSPNTVANRARCLRALANWLYQRDYTKEHQLGKLAVPKDVLEDPEIVEPNELQKMIDSIDTKAPYGMRDCCILLMLYDLGLRCGELCNLQMGDVHLEGRVGWVYVRAATTKSRKPRPVPLGARLLDTLTLYIERYRDANAIRKQAPTDHLFRNRCGQRLSPNGVLQMLHKRCDQAGVRRIHPHLLRHSNACLEIEAGAPELFVKQKLGHSDLSMTDYYSHLAARRSILKQPMVFSLVDQLKIKVDKPRKTRSDKGKPRKIKPVPPQMRVSRLLHLNN